MTYDRRDSGRRSAVYCDPYPNLPSGKFLLLNAMLDHVRLGDPFIAANDDESIMAFDPVRPDDVVVAAHDVTPDAVVTGLVVVVVVVPLTPPRLLQHSTYVNIYYINSPPYNE